VARRFDETMSCLLDLVEAATQMRGLLVFLVSALLAPATAVAQSRYDEVVRSILAAWKTADVVCLGEDHGRYYDSELRIALVRHPDFPRTVRVVVVEFANPVHQDLLDRFILDGAVMSREDLAPVWRDATGAEVWESAIYELFLRAVRDVNLGLSPDQRVRVLGGDGKIDWPRITTPEQLAPLMNRGGNIRNIIAEEVLERRVKGLAIYGAGHCSKVGGGFPGDLAGRYPADRIWSIWSLSRSGTTKGSEIFGFDHQPAYLVVRGAHSSTLSAAGLLERFERFKLGEVLDAIVYHGSVPDSVVRADLTVLNAKYGSELQRRRRLTREAFDLRPRRP
jgi:hypothetical protein